MSETKHTPGPWTVDKRGVVAHELRRGGFRRRVALTESAARHRQKETSANARLIAAAPDMLEALTALLARFDDNPELSELIGRVEIERARAAVAKAEGRS